MEGVRYSMSAKYCYFCGIFSLRWTMGQHLSVLINLKTHGMGTPHCWFKVAIFAILICLFCMKCYLDCKLWPCVFFIDKIMEAGWILRHWDVAWALDFRISSLMLSLGNVCCGVLSSISFWNKSKTLHHWIYIASCIRWKWFQD